MKRRHFVAASAATILGGSAYGLIGHAPSYRNVQPEGWADKYSAPVAGDGFKIDINHQFQAPFMGSDFIRQNGWSPERAIDWMDVNGIATAILSTPPYLMNGLSSNRAMALAASCNDYAARLCQRYPGRFAFLATLPMPFIEKCLFELGRATDHLGALGVMLPGSTAGITLGDERYIPLLEQLNQSAANVLVLPNDNPDYDQLDLDLPTGLVEHPTDVTRAAVSLVLNRRLESYPDIHWILGQAGGFLPYVAWRLSLANAMPELSARAPQGILHYLRRFWFETSNSNNPVVHAVLRELVEPEKVLFGTGGFKPEQTAEETINLEPWPSRFHGGIGRQHALSLFPTLAKPSDSPPPVPDYSEQSLWSAMLWRCLQPIKHLAQQSRS